MPDRITVVVRRGNGLWIGQAKGVCEGIGGMWLGYVGMNEGFGKGMKKPWLKGWEVIW